MSIRKVALPNEHGSWNFVLEPLILSLIVAFSTNGLILALAAFILFLSRQPIKYITGKNAPKLKTTAKKVLAFYFSIVFLLFLYLIFNSELRLRLPYGTALLLMLFYLYLEYKGRSRELIFEFIPPVAITLMSISIILMNGNFAYNAFVYGVLLLSRSLPTIVYIHAKVMEMKNKPYKELPTHIINITFLLLIFFLISNNMLPQLTIAGPIIMLIRAVIGFSKFNFTKTVMLIGLAEFTYGVIIVVINAIALT
jgi:hypothetical protein